MVVPSFKGGIVVRNNPLIRQGTPQEKKLERQILGDYQASVKATTYSGKDVRTLAKTSGYTVTRYPNGKIKTIAKMPVVYESYNYYRKSSSKNVTRKVTNAKYIPYEVTLRPDGTILREVSRGVYNSESDKETSKGYSYKVVKNNVYETEIIDYGLNSNPIKVLKKEKYRATYESGKGISYKQDDTFVSSVIDFNKGVQTEYSRPNTEYYQRVTPVATPTPKPITLSAALTDAAKKKYTSLSQRKIVVGSNLFGTSKNVYKSNGGGIILSESLKQRQTVPVSSSIRAVTTQKSSQSVVNSVFQNNAKPLMLLGALAYYFNYR